MAFLDRPQLSIMAVGLIAAALIALPGVTVTTGALDQLFPVFDDIHRLNRGEVPSRATPLGPLAFYLPMWGFRLTGSYGGSMPAAVAIATVVLAGFAAHVLASRLRPFLALLLGGFLLLVLAAPNNLGDPLNILSFASFTNRLAWVALALLLVMYLAPARPQSGGVIADAACATLLTLVLLYTRAPFGLVAAAFLLAILVDRRQRRWAASSLVAVAVTAGIVELVWGASADYARDVWESLAAMGLLRGGPGQSFDLMLANLTDFLLLGLIAGVALWRGFSLRHACFFAFCGLAGYWLINHTAQWWGIVIIHAAAFVAAEIALRRMDASPALEGKWINAGGVKLFALAIVLPTILHAGTALGLHAGVAGAGAGRTIELGAIDRVRLVDLWTGGSFGGSTWYIGTIDDGLRMLSTVDGEPVPLVVLGGADPFSAALNLPPVERGARSQIDPGKPIAPEDFLGDAGLVLERLSAGGAGPLGELYLPFVRRNFIEVAETGHWRLYRREASSPGTAAQ